MKPLFKAAALFLLITLSTVLTGYSQSITSISLQKRGTAVAKGGLYADSILSIAKRDTIIPTWTPTRARIGALVIRSADSLVYVNNGNKFVCITNYPQIFASDSLDHASTATLLSDDQSMTVTGAAMGDPVSVGTHSVIANCSWTAYVSAANTVRVRFNNYSGGTVNPAKQLFNVIVTKITRR